MKNQLLLFALIASLFSTFLLSCSADDDGLEATIIGRWQLEGFENAIRYEFTTSKRFDIYVNGDGTFPTLEKFRQENPSLQGLDWNYSGDTIVIDLNFGNYSRLLPVFKCDNYVIDWLDDSSNTHSTYYKEGHNLVSCR